MNLTENQKIAIFVISLARIPERRSSIEHHLTNLGLCYEIIEAVDGHNLSIDERNKLLAPGVTYVPGVIGCYLSHILVYKEIVKRDLPIALILEDDARLNPAIVPALLSGSVTRNYEYCLLDSDNISENIPIYYAPDSRQLLADGFPIYQTNAGPALLHAYLMTLKGAQRRIAHAWPIFKPIDVYHHLPYQPDIRVCVNPKGAWVSEHSRHSFTSNRNETAPLRLKFFRQFPCYFKLVDWIKLKPVKGILAIPKLKRIGILDPNRRWCPMPSGRIIHGGPK